MAFYKTHSPSPTNPLMTRCGYPTFKVFLDSHTLTGRVTCKRCLKHIEHEKRLDEKLSQITNKNCNSEYDWEEEESQK